VVLRVIRAIRGYIWLKCDPLEIERKITTCVIKSG